MYTRVVYGRRNGAYNYSEFVIDTEADLVNLPTTKQDGVTEGQRYNPCSVGSKAYVADFRKSYILNNNDEWKVFINYAYQGGSGASFEVEDDGDGNVSIV